MEGKVVECAVCRTKMIIPPGYENMAARCRSCGTALNQGPQLAGAILDTGPVAPLVSHPKPEPESKSAIVKKTVLSAFLWGCAGGVAGSVILGLLTMAVFGTAGPHQARTAVFGGAEFGLLLGFLLGSMWGLVTALELSMGRAAAVGAPVGLVLSVAHHLLEASLVAPPDNPVYITGLMGIGAGAFVGLVSAWFKDYWENA